MHAFFGIDAVPTPLRKKCYGRVWGHLYPTVSSYATPPNSATNRPLACPPHRVSKRRSRCAAPLVCNAHQNKTAAPIPCGVSYPGLQASDYNN